MLSLLVVAAAGGLGQAIVREGLARGHNVSVLVRSKDKLVDALGASDVGRLSAVYEGDATNAGVVASAVRGKNVVLSGIGSQPGLAKTVRASGGSIDPGGQRPAVK